MPWDSIFADKYSATFSGSIFADAHKDINNYVHAHICSFHVFKNVRGWFYDFTANTMKHCHVAMLHTEVYTHHFMQSI